MFWPSFNAVMSTGNSQHRIILNTVLSLSAAIMGTFFSSNLFNSGKFKMDAVLNATLAGGVAIGAGCDLVTEPWVPLCVGFTAGALSTIGFERIQPWLYEKLDLHDVGGIHNLHGMPGVLGAFVGTVFCFLASAETYGDSLHELFPEFAKGRTPMTQALVQMGTLATTLVLSFGGGMIAGKLMNMKALHPLAAEECFDDAVHWVMEETDVPLEMRVEALENPGRKLR